MIRIPGTRSMIKIPGTNGGTNGGANGGTHGRWTLLALSLSVACLEDAPIPSPQPADRPTQRAAEAGEEVEKEEDEIAASTATSCTGDPVPLLLQGRVWNDAGGVPNLRMGTVGAGGALHELARTDADGRYKMEVEGPAIYTVLDVVSTPGERCSHDGMVAAPPADQGATQPLLQEQDFKVADLCPLSVQVLSPTGQPLAGAQVELWSVHSLEPLRGVELTDAGGFTQISHAPCKPTSLAAFHEGLLPDHEGARLPEAPGSACAGLTFFRPGACLTLKRGQSPPQVVLSTRPAVRLEGTIHDERGEPVAAARVWTEHGQTTSDAHGRYALWVPEDDLPGVIAHVEARGFADAHSGFMTHGVEPAPGESLRRLGTERWTRDFTLERVREIDVRCLGLSPESCRQLSPYCASADGAERKRCSYFDYKNDGLCSCPPSGEVVISAGGVAVLVSETDDIAWLDFRAMQGGVKGKVDGAERCDVSVSRPNKWLHMMRDLDEGYRSVDCAGDGSFELYRLPPGSWTIKVNRRGDPDPDAGLLSKTGLLGGESESVDVQISNEVVDVGLITFSE